MRPACESRPSRRLPNSAIAVLRAAASIREFLCGWPTVIRELVEAASGKRQAETLLSMRRMPITRLGACSGRSVEALRRRQAPAKRSSPIAPCSTKANGLYPAPEEARTHSNWERTRKGKPHNVAFSHSGAAFGGNQW